MNTPTLPVEIINKILIMREPNPIYILMRNYHTKMKEMKIYIKKTEEETWNELEDFFTNYTPLD